VLTSDYGLGASVTGWQLQGATAMSPDGRSIVGYGVNPSGAAEAWLVRLDVAEPDLGWLLPLGTAALVAGSALSKRRRPAQG